MNERESEWQTREHSCEQEAREKSLAVIDRPKGKGQCAKVQERRAQQTMQIYLSVQYGTESNWQSTDWPPPTYWPQDTLRRLMPLTVATGSLSRSFAIHRSSYWHWLAFQLRGVCTAAAAAVAKDTILHCTAAGAVIIQLHKEVSQQQQQCA